jgi:MATE family multidrug resistance protein
MLVVMLFRTRLTAEQRPGIILRVTLAAVPLNAVLDYALMYGVGGWEGYGLTGAGVASFLVASAMAAALAVGGRVRAERGVVEPIDWRDVGDVLRTGLQIGVATVAEVGIFLGATLFAATLSAPEVAAHAVAIRAAGLAYALPSGLLQAAMVRAARAEDCPEARRAAITTSLALAAVAGVLLCAVLAMLAGPIAGHLFTAAPEGRAAAEVAVALLVTVA